MRGFFFRGRPPLRPLTRAASALALLVACPPRRPSATAAGFLGGIDQQSVRFVEGDPFGARHGKIFWRNAVAIWGIRSASVVALCHRQRLTERCGLVFSELFTKTIGMVVPDMQDGVGACLSHHAVNIPYRLGYVKWAEIGLKTAGAQA